MGVNQAENSTEDRLVNMIKDLQRQVLELRTKQKIGADAISTRATTTYTFGPITIAAATYSYFSITTTPNIPTLTIWNHEVTVYVDSNGLDNYSFPTGSFLTGGKEKMRQSVWLDWYNSNDAIGARNVKILIENTDTASHNYYIKFNSVSPQLPLN